MRLLDQDNFFGMLGAVLISAIPAVLAWMALELVLGLPPWMAMPAGLALTGGGLEMVSRRLEAGPEGEPALSVLPGGGVTPAMAGEAPALGLRPETA